MHELCIIGSVTKDVILRDGLPLRTGPGGVAYYAALAANALGVDVKVLTRLANADRGLLLGDFVIHDIPVRCFDAVTTLTYENAFDSRDPDARRHRILVESSPFDFEFLDHIAARFIHLGPLTPHEMDVGFIRAAKEKAALVAMDVQGFVRHSADGRVVLMDWPDKAEALASIDILKADAAEAKILTGESDEKYAARVLSEMGPREVLVTMGSRGSVVFCEGGTFEIPAFAAGPVVDTIGCGDTYMAAYLAKRLQNDDVREAALYASEIAGLKAQVMGAFREFPKE